MVLYWHSIVFLVCHYSGLSLSKTFNSARQRPNDEDEGLRWYWSMGLMGQYQRNVNPIHKNDFFFKGMIKLKAF